ncbi:hypothetical protein BDK51DRAFT_35295 [Blyttiomyces helicus]|uniref:Uncharacterized protein n=1 Tax=Blyttiomyces helicus TaxID=388810 RepID=A0A4V1IQT9_9FUNG|nr:hypothetical protein BDK51DRAFT_35295 [Blyttiomyces helicus]|eukprot:RKO87717.1 hypothetical protein BDK51DRAFT_35295 [Blyttiomyces helicus]
MVNWWFSTQEGQNWWAEDPISKVIDGWRAQEGCQEEGGTHCSNSFKEWGQPEKMEPTQDDNVFNLKEGALGGGDKWSLWFSRQEGSENCIWPVPALSQTPTKGAFGWRFSSVTTLGDRVQVIGPFRIYGCFDTSQGNFGLEATSPGCGQPEGLDGRCGLRGRGGEGPVGWKYGVKQASWSFWRPLLGMRKDGEKRNHHTCSRTIEKIKISELECAEDGPRGFGVQYHIPAGFMFVFPGVMGAARKAPVENGRSSPLDQPDDLAVDDGHGFEAGGGAELLGGKYGVCGITAKTSVVH